MPRRLTIDDVKKYVKENTKCTLLSTKYINCSTKLKFKCECGNEFERTFNKLKDASQIKCPECSLKEKNKSQTWDTEKFKQKIFEKYGDDYEVIGEYKTARIKIKVKHTKCGTEYFVQPNSLLRGYECRKCSGYEKLTTQIYKDRVKELCGEEYSVLGEYINTATKILMRHNKCNHKFRVKPNNFLSQGTRCPCCNESHGEKIIYNFLKNYGINFKEQYRIKECRNKRPLPFDFAVFENNNLKLLIEYDGEQHFSPKEKFGGENEFSRRISNDDLKNKFCADNNIKLLRIPYWEKDNIDYILKSAIR